MHRMKQLARSVVYWPHIDHDIEKLVRACTPCAEHQKTLPKSVNHLCMLPEKPWSQLHPKWNKKPRWIPAIVVKVYGTRSVNVRFLPRGATCQRHVDQLRPRFGADQDKDPGDDPAETMSAQFDQQLTDSPRIQVSLVEQSY